MNGHRHATPDQLDVCFKAAWELIKEGLSMSNCVNDPLHVTLNLLGVTLASIDDTAQRSALTAMVAGELQQSVEHHVRQGYERKALRSAGIQAKEALRRASRRVSTLKNGGGT